MASNSLKIVDMNRHARKLMIAEEKLEQEANENTIRLKQIGRRLGWPFSIGLISATDMKEDYQKGWEGVCLCRLDE